MSNIKNHLYNVHLRDGLHRMTEREIDRDLGPEAWDHFGDYIDHSEWCDCRKTNVDESGALIDPWLNAYGDSAPPF